MPTARIPKKWRPRLRDLPQLGWVHARAYSPNTLIGLIVYPMGLGMVASLHARGALVTGPGRRALLAALPGGRPGPIQWTRGILGGAAGLAAGFAPFIAASLLAGYLLITPPVVHLIPVTLLIGLVSAPAAVPALGAAVLLLEAPSIITAATAVRRVCRTRTDRGTQARVLGNFAAWPTRHRHGSTLLSGLLADPDLTGTFLTVARTDELADWYRSLGMQPDPTDDRVLYLDKSAPQRPR